MAFDNIRLSSVAAVVDHFDWAPVSDQLAGNPFQVTVTAENSSGATVTDFTGPVNLSASTGTGVSSESILGNPTHDSASSGNYTLGYAFTPNTDIFVTDVQHYFGNKVSIWTDSGVLLSSTPVTSVPGTWVTTPIVTPLQLSAGTRYRVAAYTNNQNYYWRTNLGAAFPDGVINTSYEVSGDGFPTSTDSVQWWFVGLQYDVGGGGPIPITPNVSGSFVNGVWTGNVTVNGPGNDVRLYADDGLGHTGDSNTFDVFATNSDFGDAPDPTYPTLIANNGASHTAIGPRLGASRDIEPDGQPSSNADGDDTNGTPDDEDGVSFVASTLFASIFGNNNTATVQIDLQNASQSSNRLDAWIDFNQNGDWNDSGERIFNNYDLGTSGGVQTLTFTIPQDTGANVELGDTFSRFRLSTAGGLLATGPASNGEVEDHKLSIVAETLGVDHFDWFPVTEQGVDRPFQVTVVAEDVTGATVTGFTGTANLSGYTGSLTGTESLLGNPPHVNAGSGNWTLGYSFTPNTDILVTGVQHYFGTEVSIWTDGGVLLSSTPVASVPGTWITTPLATPLQLTAGTRYRVGGYTGGGSYYWRTDLGTTFPNGTIDVSYYSSGDNFPTTADNVRWWFAGLQYDVGATTSVPITPIITGNFINGVWTGNVTVHDAFDDVFLRADDGLGHAGNSNAFDVVEVNLDYGDAPDPAYPTLRVNNGARHTATGPLLGIYRDTEVNGQPTLTAFGDDLDGTPDDEDGVVFTSALVGGQAATVEVTASGSGLLSAWIDFNSDGDWADVGEQIFTDVSLQAGLNSLNFAVPTTPTDRTYARFRFSTAGGLSYDGLAPDGEVEDYGFGAIAGTKWNDLDSDGVRDQGEPGLEGWTIYLDQNGDGQRLTNVSLEPDNYDAGTLLNNIAPGVTLSAVGSSSSDVYAGFPLGGYASTGDLAFTRNGPFGWGTSIRLRVDFATPVEFVSIDAISDDALDVGTLAAYDANNNLLETYTTGNLAAGVAETMLIARLTPDIAYVIANGAAGDVLNLDNLQFTYSDPFTTTDANGNYQFVNLAAGDFIVREEQQPGWVQTYAPRSSRLTKART